MKTIALFISTFFLIASLFAQSPQSFRYQAVARNNSGNILANQSVSFRISILGSSIWGATVYCETHTGLTTNAFGLAELELGKGTPLTGTFSAIDWGSNSYFVKIEMDPAGGSAYQVLSTSQLLSVPYALHANTVQTGDNWGSQTVTANTTLSGNGTSATPLDIADNGVTSEKIQDGTVANADLADNAVTSLKIADGNIVTADVANSTVTTEKLGNLAVSTAKIQNGAVTSEKLAGNAVTETKINPGAVTGTKIAQSGATSGQVLKWNGATWAPDTDETGVLQWQNSGADIYFNTGKVGIGKIPGADFRQFQVLTANNQAIAAVNNSGGYPAMYIQNQGIGPAAEFRNFIKIADGTEGEGKILTSNATGSASWKPLAVVTDATLTGSGTAASPLKLAQMGASTGQVLKWTGSTWDNAADNTGPLTESDLYIYNTSAKKFGIGTSSPSRKVTIAETGTEAYMNIHNSSTGYTISDGILIGMQGVNGWLTTYEDGVLNIGTNGTMKMIIEAGGDVGIGTTNPGYKLQVGNIGDGSQARANAWNVFSDVNLKRDLTRLTNPLTIIERLTGYYFYWNTGIDQSRQIGFSAQEVNEVLPEVVSKGEDGYLSMEYSKITPLLVEAIKELKAENDLLKKRIEQIEALLKTTAKD